MTDNARGTRSTVTETDLELGDGRTLHVYDTGADGADGRLAVFRGGESRRKRVVKAPARHRLLFREVR